MNPTNPAGVDAEQPQPSTPAERDFSLDRLIFFSDAVFAIAITLVAFDIRLPSLPPLATDAQVSGALLALGPQYYSFAISFLAIGLFWLAHHRAFQFIARYDSILLLLNLLLLMLIAFIPFASYVVGAYDDRTTTVFYALVVAATGVLSTALWLYASIGSRLLKQRLDRRTFRFNFIRYSQTPLLFVLSAVIAQWSPLLARDTWFAIAILALAFVPLSRRLAGTQ